MPAEAIYSTAVNELWSSSLFPFYAILQQMELRLSNVVISYIACFVQNKVHT